MLGINKIFGDEKEKVFRNAANFSIVLNAIAQISQKSERSHGKLKTKVKGRTDQLVVSFTGLYRGQDA